MIAFKLTPPEKYPLPWHHHRPRNRMSAVVAGNGALVCGSFISQVAAEDIKVHAFIVQQANMAFGPKPSKEARS